MEAKGQLQPSPPPPQYALLREKDLRYPLIGLTPEPVGMFSELCRELNPCSSSPTTLSHIHITLMGILMLSSHAYLIA